MALVFLGIWILFLVAGYNIGKGKQIGPIGGAALCGIFGLVGLIVLLCLSKKRKEDLSELGFSEDITGQ